jgi:membrane-associated phospholipid phosphatase
LTLNRRVLLLIVLVALGVAILATVLAGATLWDVATVRAFQGSGALRLPAQAVTTFGAQEFFLLLLSLVFWCIDKPLGIDLALLLTIAGTANIMLKAFLHLPRPFWSDPALQLTSGSSYSTPSGHAANSTVFLGYMAWWLAARRPSPQPRPSRRRDGVAALSLLAIFFVSISRVYLGVHFPGDVIWGCAEGIVLLVAYVGLRPRSAIWLHRRSPATHVLLAAAAASAVLALNLVFLASSAGLAPTYGVVALQARAEALSEAGDVAGLVFGAWVGLALEGRYVRFATSGPLAQRALRYSLGLAGLLVVWLGLRLVLPAEPLALGLALRVLRYAAVALWAVFAWPWLFVRAGLAPAEPPTGTTRSTP